MNRQDAMELVTRISDIWPRGGIANHVWEEVLITEYSDPERARRAVEKMKRTVSYVDIGKFHDAYMAAPTSIDVGEPVICGDCTNSGWVEAQPYVRSGAEYSACKPCPHCRHGHKVSQSTIVKERKALRAPTTTETAA